MEQSQEAHFKRAYQKYMEQEGIPIYETVGGVEDAAELPRGPWARTGGLGTFIEMRGMIEGNRGTYVAEIPGGGALNPEKHVYDEAILVLKGRGITEVWQEGGTKVSFEWGEGSLFAPPLNAWHRLVNGTQEPAVFLAFTTAPAVIDALNDTDFVFNCEHRFVNRWDGQADFFAATEDRHAIGGSDRSASRWETNFIPDVGTAFLEDRRNKVYNNWAIGYLMSGDFPHGHMAEWPVGRYNRAHYHGPGFLIFGIKGEGYSLLWPKDAGTRPYQDGHEEQVIQLKWGPRGILTPPTDWFHMHMNTGSEHARQIAIYGSFAPTPSFKFYEGDDNRVIIGIREGGTLLDYEDEDPEIRRRYEAVLKEKGIECTMPKVTYRQERPPLLSSLVK